MAETARDRVIRLIREMQNRTVERGATPAEAAAFAAKVSEWIEKYQIEEAELRQSGAASEPTIEMYQETWWTGKTVANPGVSQLVMGLANGMTCKTILLSRKNDGIFKEAGYGIVGDVIDAQFVVQMTKHLLPQLTTMARMEAAEHGFEKASLVRWVNNYLAGAGQEIEKVLKERRAARSTAKEADALIAGKANALVVTGDSLAEVKTKAVALEFRRLYPRTKQTHSHSRYEGDAHARGRAAGRSVGLDLPMGGGSQGRIK